MKDNLIFLYKNKTLPTFYVRGKNHSTKKLFQIYQSIHYVAKSAQQSPGLTFRLFFLNVF